jgi:hypothetical protein
LFSSFLSELLRSLLPLSGLFRSGSRSGGLLIRSSCMPGAFEPRDSFKESPQTAPFARSSPKQRFWHQTFGEVLMAILYVRV